MNKCLFEFAMISTIMRNRVVGCLAIGVQLCVAQNTPPQGRLLVANLKEHSLLFLDVTNRQAVASVSIGVSGHEITLSKDGKLAYVPIYSDAVLGDPESAEGYPRRSIWADPCDRTRLSLDRTDCFM